ncbi:MAG: DEAD/DEAH box helicase, partial [Gammaproteobacteria bacterium]
MNEQVLSEVAFADLPLDPSLKDSLAEIKFTHCTPIQALSLPHALEGKDVAGQAQTGTGKSAAFLLATMHRLLTKPAPEDRRQNQVRALILAPTRELAIQIHKDAMDLGSQTGLRLGLAYGGTGYESQRKVIEDGVDILIGTPGRVIDYFKQRVFDLKICDVVVMDEADRMFDLGFITDVRYLLRRCPPPDQRLGLLFSATLSCRVTELAFEHMNEPVEVKVESENVTADRVRQVMYHTANTDKIPLLIKLLKEMEAHRTLIFVNTKRAADRVCGYLLGNDIPSSVLSGDVPQNKRQHLLKDFGSGKLDVLVATDVAARGLHIPDVSHVVNFDLPQDAEDYVHRIGRTARFDAEGDAISFACEDYAYSLPDIEQYIEQKIPLEHYDPFDLPELKKPVRVRNRLEDKDGGRGRGGGGGRDRDGRGRRDGGGGRGGRGRGRGHGDSRSGRRDDGDRPPREARSENAPAKNREGSGTDQPRRSRGEKAALFSTPPGGNTPQEPRNSDGAPSEDNGPRQRRRRRRGRGNGDGAPSDAGS